MPKKDALTSPAAAKDARAEPQQPIRSRPQSDARRRHAESRRQQIFSGALSCFQQKGYHDTTLSDIARASGISSGLIYQYFSDKRDVLFQVILEILENYNREVPRAIVGIEHPILRLRAAISAYSLVIDRNIAPTILAYRETKLLNRDQIDILKAKEVQTNQMITGVLSDCVALGYCRPIDVELITYFILSMAHMWALKNWRLKKIVSHETYLSESMAMILRDILTVEGVAEARSLGLLLD